MAESERKYFIRLEKQLVEVSHEVYAAYYQMDRQGRYQRERDMKHGLLYYDSWDTEDTNGEEFIEDTSEHTEEQVINSITIETILQYINQIDERKISYYLISGKTETEIAELLCMSQSQINRIKKKILKQLQSYLEKNFKYF